MPIRCNTQRIGTIRYIRNMFSSHGRAVNSQIKTLKSEDSYMGFYETLFPNGTCISAKKISKENLMGNRVKKEKHIMLVEGKVVQEKDFIQEGYALLKELRRIVNIKKYDKNNNLVLEERIQKTYISNGISEKNKTIYEPINLFLTRQKGDKHEEYRLTYKQLNKTINNQEFETEIIPDKETFIKMMGKILRG